MTRELSASVRAKEDRAEWREATFATAWRKGGYRGERIGEKVWERSRSGEIKRVAFGYR